MTFSDEQKERAAQALAALGTDVPWRALTNKDYWRTKAGVALATVAGEVVPRALADEMAQELSNAQDKITGDDFDWLLDQDDGRRLRCARAQAGLDRQDDGRRLQQAHRVRPRCVQKGGG
jgi:hypothetical protein